MNYCILKHFPERYQRVRKPIYILAVILYILCMGIWLGTNMLYWGFAILCICALFNYRHLRDMLHIDQVKNTNLRAAVSVLLIFAVATVGFLLNQVLSMLMLVILVPIGNDVLSLYDNLGITKKNSGMQTILMLVTLLVEIGVMFAISGLFVGL